MLGDKNIDYLREIKTIYNTYLLEEHGEPVGASEADIQSYERMIGARLPEAYRQYLLWMGNDPNGVFAGTECFLQDLVRNTEYLPEFLDENGIEFKAEGIPICFYSHQGYQLAWFFIPFKMPIYNPNIAKTYQRLDGDPRCFQYFENFDEKKVRKDRQFTFFLLEQIYAGSRLNNLYSYMRT